MSFTLPQKTLTKVPVGTHVARLYSIVDLGRQIGEYRGEPTDSYQAQFTFELPNEMREFDGQKKPMVIGKRVSYSMHPKSTLRKVTEALLQVQFKDEEAYNLVLEEVIPTLLEKPCLIQVVAKEDGIGVKLDAVLPLMKGMECPPQFNETVLYRLEDGDNHVFQNLPQFLKDLIAKSKSVLTLDEEASKSVSRLREKHNEDLDPSSIPF